MSSYVIVGALTITGYQKVRMKKIWALTLRLPSRAAHNMNGGFEILYPAGPGERSISTML